MGIFDKIMEKKEMEIQKEKDRLMSLSEKELMVEIILKLNEISDKCDKIKRRV